MKTGLGLVIEQKQAMRINQAQLQKLEILQMSQLELEEKIRDELMENPVLEISEADHEDDYTTDIPGDREDLREDNSYDTYDSFDDRDYWDADFSGGLRDKDRTDGIAAFENFYRTGETLAEYLIKQLGGVSCADEVRRAAGYIIYSLNSDGYLDTELGVIESLALCSSEDAENALDVVQSLDPPGVGARSVEECLCLQLDTDSELYDDAKAVITDYLRQIAIGNIKAITGTLGITADRLIKIIDIIRTLNPKPCSQFADGRPVQYMHPDVYAEMTGEEISLHLAGSQPRLCLSQYYSALYRNSEDAAVKDYLKERIDSASRFIQNINQRNRTLLSVSKAILRHQRRFVEEGPGFLVPLTMADIAEELDISVSTVSRAVNGKNVHLGGKTYALRQLFTSEVSGTSKDSVVERIRAFISEEDPMHPLSDQKIADMLMKEGLDISRRTVAKYRDGAGILPKSMRKKQ